ncbi:DUF192 domain-containing protein [Cellulophaga omnivescoria]|uniref:DUF192 domain-containing protein n=1 Tax=Cellulophaga omnivescoria TaxID=1888890 RepID=UPI0022F13581|nr:DUF192 domain-containing protein [Cellulophaga omnivescoria]WBU88484.1 DUF192 domain-containing protein [Cellulophaga omnivescoria]
MKTLKHYSLLLITIFSLLTSCKENKTEVIKTPEPAFTKEGTLTIIKSTDNSKALLLDIEIAETDYETQTGLMQRTSMKENQGMLFIFPDSRIHSFYMKNTKIALDIIYIDENLHIASFQENAKPLDETGLSSKVPVMYVLEINAGLSEKYMLEVGDKIDFTRL